MCAWRGAVSLNQVHSGECGICPEVSCGPRGQLKVKASRQGAEEGGLLSAPWSSQVSPGDP